MVEEPENLVLQMLRWMDAKLDRADERLDCVVEDLHDRKVHMTHVEEGLAGVNLRLNRLEVRVERIETRFELVDSPYSGVRE